jgi:hypothetical protein
MGLDGHKLLGAIVPELRAKAETIDQLGERFRLEADEGIAAEVGETMRWLWNKHMDRVA